MKNLRHLFTALLLLCSGIATAEDFEVGGIYYNITDETNKTVEVTRLSYTGDVVIPESVTYNNVIYSVTSIGEDAFYYCDGLTSIEIPNSVTSIGNWAFSGCSGLKEVHISDLSAWCNTEFGSSDANPLFYANKLYLNGKLVTDLVIPDGISEIKNYAFQGCSGLASIEIPNSVTSIGNCAFNVCSGLTSVTIPNSVTSIGDYAFYGCSGLASIEIPNSVTSIGVWAFNGTAWYYNQPYGLIYLNGWLLDYKGDEPTGDITISEGTKGIADSAFYDCSGLTSVTIGNSVTSIGEWAFSFCSGLTSVTIGNSVTSIGGSAFSFCSGLTNVTIGKGVINMGAGVFRKCPAITTITLLGEIPPVVSTYDYEYDFTPEQYESVALYVPEGSLDVYKLAYIWKEFLNIEGIDFTGIEEVVSESKDDRAKGKTVYDLNGRKVENLANGIYIVDGKKVLVK